MNSYQYLPLYSRPTFIEIKKSAIIKNIKSLYQFVNKNKESKNKIKICAIIKSNAYGHGLKQVAEVIKNLPEVEFLGVTSLEEGVILRELNIKKPILLLGSIFPFENFKEIINYDITPTVASVSLMKELNKYLKKIGKKISFHLKIDTGMGRIGILPESVMNFVEEYKNLRNVYCEGIYTHFSSAASDKEYTFYQLELFNNFYKTLLKYEIKPKYIHTANSAASVLYPESYFNIIRPGLVIYGLKPCEGVEKFVSIEPVLALKSKIVFLKTLPKGKYISYSKTYKTKRKTKVATLPIGYADGILRKLSNRGKVLVKGEFCNIIGRVTMDMIMVDITSVKDVCVGDEVVLIGRQNDKEITAEEVALWSETINYEVVTLLSQRIPRVVV